MWSKNLRVPIILAAGGGVVVLLSAFTAPTGCLDYVLRHASLYSRIRRALGMFAAILESSNKLNGILEEQDKEHCSFAG